MKYLLLDLERTLRTVSTWYWRPHRRGYTKYLSEAGHYSEEEAKRIVESDFNQHTIMVPVDVVERIRAS